MGADPVNFDPIQGTKPEVVGVPGVHSFTTPWYQYLVVLDSVA